MNQSNHELDAVLVYVGGSIVEFTKIAPGTTVEQSFARQLLEHKSRLLISGFGTVGSRNFTTPVAYSDSARVYNEVVLTIKTELESTVQLR